MHDYFHVYISAYFTIISVYVTSCQTPIFNSTCRSAVISSVCHYIKTLHFSPISSSKIFMPACIYRVYQYVESLTWDTLKQVIRVYCTIKSMTFFKIFGGRQNIHYCDLVHGPQTFKNTQCVYILIHVFILFVNEQ